MVVLTLTSVDKIQRCDHSFYTTNFENFHLRLVRFEKSTFCFQVSASKQQVHDTRMWTLK